MEEHHSARSFRVQHGVASRIINVARKLRSSVRAGYIHDSISLPVRACATSICRIELTINLANSPSAHAGQFAAQPLIKEASVGRANASTCKNYSTRKIWDQHQLHPRLPPQSLPR
eukprot:s5375_g5.t1